VLLNKVEVTVILAQLSGFNRDQLMAKSDDLKSSLKEPSIYILTSESATIIGVVKLGGVVSAGDLFKKLSLKFGGKGGGRSDLAQGLIDLKNRSHDEIINTIKEVTT
jgi:alanyl-tRNA synthetase